MSLHNRSHKPLPPEMLCEGDYYTEPLCIRRIREAVEGLIMADEITPNSPNALQGDVRHGLKVNCIGIDATTTNIKLYVLHWPPHTSYHTHLIGYIGHNVNINYNSALTHSILRKQISMISHKQHDILFS